MACGLAGQVSHRQRWAKRMSHDGTFEPLESDRPETPDDSADTDDAGDGFEAPEAAEPTPLLEGQRVAFWGKLGGLNRREAQQLVRKHGGLCVDPFDDSLSLLVVGADELPLHDLHQLEFLDQRMRQAMGEGRLEVVSETVLWERLELVEAEHQIRRLYTPAMLADLLGVSVAKVRSWHRRKLIVPARMVHRLPYFDFQEVATAQRIAELLSAGASPREIEAKLEALAKFVPGVERPLAQLSVIVEGKQILLREGEGLIEPGGQLRLNFDAPEEDQDEPVALAMDWEQELETATPDQMLDMAARLEEEGALAEAAELYRAILAAIGPDPEICFQLAEALYRLGHVEAATERYYMAIELDEDYVEARANLGCVLAETGELELAAAAFQGALAHHDGYPDVHFHLARVLDDMGEVEEAEGHWRRFLSLSPDSPWADEARLRLS